MTFLVWAEGETEHDGQYVHASTEEDAVSGYMVGAIRRGKGFEELARDRGSLVFFVKDDSWVQRVRVAAHFSVRLEKAVAE